MLKSNKIILFLFVYSAVVGGIFFMHEGFCYFGWQYYVEIVSSWMILFYV